MAATLEEISGFLDEMGWKHKVLEEKQRIITGHATESYVDDRGEDGFMIVISLQEDGGYIKIEAPQCYVYNPKKDHHEFLDALLIVSWRTKLIQYEYDPADGEIRALIEFPLEDAKLTKLQLERCLEGLVQIIDRYHPMLMIARDTGEIKTPEELEKEFQEFLAQRRRGSGGNGLQLDE